MSHKIRQLNPWRKYVFWFLFCFSCLVVAYGNFLATQPFLNGPPLSTKIDHTVLNLQKPVPKVSALSYLVGELNSQQILIAKNENLHLFPASLSKLMTAILALDNLTNNDTIEISSFAVSAEGEEGNLQVGEHFYLEDLLKILLVTSSNDAAVAIEEALTKQGKNIVALAEDKTHEFQMGDSAFFDSRGLDRTGNFSTALDLFKLSQAIYRQYPVIGEITRQPQLTVYSLEGRAHNLVNTNELVGKIDNLWGGKTGLTQEAGGCLLTIYEFASRADSNNKIAIAIIVLNSLDRFNDTIALYNWVKQTLTATNF